jgi:Bacterial toxin homologue of phage lysozyme, C-term
MAFEFVGRKLHDGVDQTKSSRRFDDLDHLEGEVGNGRENRPRDVVRVKTVFRRLGRVEKPEHGFSGFIDGPLDGAIRSFQRANNLRQDGFLRPGGPTQRQLQSQLRRIADIRDEPRHRIDFDFISDREGGQQLQGYVPRHNKSGVTIGTGVDLGQRSAEEIDRLDLPKSLRDKLKPFAGMRRVQASEALHRNPLRVTKEEADLLDREVHRDTINTIIESYNRRSRFDFRDLPSPMQTVITSVGFQHGPSLTTVPRFLKFATEANLPGMIAELRNFKDDHPERRNLEADYLERNIPRPKLKPRL